MKILVKTVAVVAAVGLLVGCDTTTLSLNPHRVFVRTILPHPCPLPLGEGELSASALKCRTTGLVHGPDARPYQDQLAAKYTDQFLNQLATCSVH